MTSDLPSHSSAVEEKLERQHKSSWTRPVSLAIPGVRSRRLRILVPNAGPFNRLHVARMKRKRGPLLVAVACLAVFFTVVIVSKGVGHSDQWQGGSVTEPSTLVFSREDLQRVWKWEIASGHYPSSASSTLPTPPPSRTCEPFIIRLPNFSLVPQQIGLTEKVLNPATPPQPQAIKPSRYRSPGVEIVTEATGAGPKRVYLDIQSHPPNVVYPPRPVPGSVADLDHVMSHCDFGQRKVKFFLASIAVRCLIFLSLLHSMFVIV